jgi:hypothetical protein
MEYLEELEIDPFRRVDGHLLDASTGTLRRRPWVFNVRKAYKSLAILFVVGGIAGEGVFEYLGAKGETAVREFDQRRNMAAQQDASARLEAAKQDIDEATDTLGRQIKNQGPRYVFLNEVADDLIKELKQFSGQKVVMVACGRWERMTPEMNGFVGTVITILNKSGWTTEARFDESCVVAETIGVYFRPDEGKNNRTRAAADFLGKRLSKLIPGAPARAMPMYATPPELDSALRTFTDALLSRPDTVMIHIGAHP